MKYKGYVGYVSYDENARTFYGEVIGLKDLTTFQGDSVDELEEAFKDSVDEYLEWCREEDQEPQKTYSGNLQLRMGSDLHARLAREAAVKDMSLNDLILRKLEIS